VAFILLGASRSDLPSQTPTFSNSYLSILHRHLGGSIGPLRLDLSIAHRISEGRMMLFFLASRFPRRTVDWDTS
jgi:Na+/H+ antiporter NhaA